MDKPSNWKSKIKSKLKKDGSSSKSRRVGSTIRSSTSHNSLILDQDTPIGDFSTLRKPKHQSSAPYNDLSTPPVISSPRDSGKFKKAFTFHEGMDFKNSDTTPNIPNNTNSSSGIQPHELMTSVEFPNIQEMLEDSPVAREKMRKLEQHMETMAASVRKVVKLSKQVQSVGIQYNQLASQFAEELKLFRYFEDPFYTSHKQIEKPNEASSSSSSVEEYEFAEVIGNICMAFSEVNEYQATLMKQMSTIFTVPMDQFMKKDFRELKEISKSHKIIKLRYDNAVSKFSHLKKNESDKVITDLESELLYFRKEFQQSSLSYLSKMKELKLNTPIEFFERASAFLYAEKAYFQHGHNLHHDIEQKLAAFFKQTTQNRDQIAKQIEEFKSKIGEIEGGFTENQHQFKSKEGSRTISEVEIKGYLFIKESNKWSRRFFHIHDGHLFCLRNNKETKKIAEVEIANLLLCTVRPARDVERRACFEVVSPFATNILQAENDEQLNNWMQVIQNAIASQLNNQMTKKNPSNSNANSESSKLMLQLHQQTPENNLCIDCGAIEPEWVSINLGILVCIECSGIHRQLGTHISKIRSLLLDALDKETQRVMFSIGNKNAKSVFEYAVDRSKVNIPTIESDRATRETWIRNKYVSKLYVKPFDAKGEGNALEFALHAAIKSRKILAVYELVCQGANINWCDKSNHSYSAFHLAIIENQAVICEYFIQNGADINIRDENDWTPLHHCAYLNRFECAILLIKRSAKLQLLDKNSKKALDIAIENEKAHCVTLLRLAMYAETEHPGNALEDESFAAALKSFSEEVTETNSYLESSNTILDDDEDDE